MPKSAFFDRIHYSVGCIIRPGALFGRIRVKVAGLHAKTQFRNDIDQFRGFGNGSKKIDFLVPRLFLAGSVGTGRFGSGRSAGWRLAAGGWRLAAGGSSWLAKQ